MNSKSKKKELDTLVYRILDKENKKKFDKEYYDVHVQIIKFITERNNKEIVLEYLSKECDNGNSMAYNYLGVYYHHTGDYISAFNLFSQSVDNDNSLGEYSYGLYLKTIQKDDSYSSWYEKSAQKGNPLAIIALGKHHLFNDTQKGLELLYPMYLMHIPLHLSEYHKNLLHKMHIEKLCTKRREEKEERRKIEQKDIEDMERRMKKIKDDNLTDFEKECAVILNDKLREARNKQMSAPQISMVRKNLEHLEDEKIRVIREVNKIFNDHDKRLNRLQDKVAELGFYLAVFSSCLVIKCLWPSSKTRH